MDWYVNTIARGTLGPLSTDALVRGLVSGELSDDAMVCVVGSNDWLEPRSVPLLAKLLQVAKEEPAAARKPAVSLGASPVGQRPRPASSRPPPVAAVAALPPLPLPPLPSPPRTGFGGTPASSRPPPGLARIASPALPSSPLPPVPRPPSPLPPAPLPPLPRSPSSAPPPLPRRASNAPPPFVRRASSSPPPPGLPPSPRLPSFGPMPVAASRSPVPPPASPVPQRPVAPSLPEDVPIDLETDSFASEIPLEQRRPSAHDLRVLAAPEAALFSAPQAPRRRGRAVGAIAAAAVLVAGAAGAALYVNPGLLRPGSDTALASAAGAARSSAAADALWSPCLSAPLAASAAPREVACGAGKLAVDRKADGTRFALGGLPPASVAQELPAHVRAVLPNLGAPSTSFAQSCENAQPAMPAATAPTGERLAAFHAAMAGLRTCRLAGGRRSARWKLDGDQELEARTEYAADGGRVLLSFGPPTAVPSSWKPAPWKAGPFMEQPAAAPDALEAALVGAGFLPGDGAALRAAAKQLRLEDPTQTVVPLAALIKLVSGASDWMLLGKTKAYATCVGPALSRIGDTDPAMRFRLLAGVTPQGAALLAEPPRPNANAETLAQRFDAASGSALHFRCALDLGCQLLRGKVLGLKQLADGLDREHAAIAQVLLCDRRFAELALTEVGASRLKLVEQ